MGALTRFLCSWASSRMLEYYTGQVLLEMVFVCFAESYYAPLLHLVTTDQG